MILDRLNELVQITRRGVKKIVDKEVTSLYLGYNYCTTDNDEWVKEYRHIAELLRDQALTGEVCLCDSEIDIIEAGINRVTYECKKGDKDFTKEENPNATEWLLQNPTCVAYEYAVDYLEALCKRISIDFKVVERKCSDVGIEIKITDHVVCDAIDIALQVEAQTCDIDLNVNVDLHQCIADVKTILTTTNCDIDLRTYVEKISCGATLQTVLEELNCQANIGVDVGDAVNCPLSPSPSVSPSASTSPSASLSPSASESPSPSASVSLSPSPSSSISPSPSEGTPHGNITGTVKDTFGNGIGGANIRLYADANEDGIADDAVILESVFSTGAGSWSIVDVIGSFVITAPTIANYTIVSGIDITDDSDNVVDSDTTDAVIPVTVESGEIDSGNNFIYTPNDGVISGTVLDNLGAPIVGATVTIYEDNNLDGVADGAAVDTVVTNGSGVYTFTGVQAGKYALGSANISYIIELTIPGGYNIVSGIDATNDGDLLVDADTTDNIIPCTLSPGETDADNNFVVQAI